MAEVRLEEVNGALVAHVAGEVDLSNVEAVRAIWRRLRAPVVKNRP